MGRGDVIELQLKDGGMNGKILQRVSVLDGIEEAYELKGRIAVRALNATSKFPELIDLIEGVGAAYSISRSAETRSRTCSFT
jgi:hypothetical protein